MAGHHIWIYKPDMCLPVEIFKNRIFRGGVIHNILFQLLIHSHLYIRVDSFDGSNISLAVSSNSEAVIIYLSAYIFNTVNLVKNKKAFSKA